MNGVLFSMAGLALTPEPARRPFKTHDQTMVELASRFSMRVSCRGSFDSRKAGTVQGSRVVGSDYFFPASTKIKLMFMPPDRVAIFNRLVASGLPAVRAA